MADNSPPFEDMFQEWNLGKYQPDPDNLNVVDEPAWWEKYCELQHKCQLCFEFSIENARMEKTIS